MKLQAIENLDGKIVDLKWQKSHWFIANFERWLRLMFPQDWVDEGGYWSSCGGYFIPLALTAFFEDIVSEGR